MTTANEDPRLGLMDIPRKMARSALAIIGVIVMAVLAVFLWFLLQPDPIVAARTGDFKAIESLVRKDPDIVNRAFDRGWTLLFAAAYGDQPEIVEFLIESGADPNLPIGRQEGTYALRPVHAAAEQGSTRAMKALAEGGADLNALDDFLGRPPIMLAAGRGHLDVVKFLLDAGVDPNTNDWRPTEHDPELQTGFTTLEMAVINVYPEIVKLLIERGAEVAYLQDGWQHSALHTFIFHAPLREYQNERYERWVRNIPTMIDLLVEELGDVNFREGGDTPLHEAAGIVGGESLPIVRYLVEHYPELDVNAKDAFGNTPLHVAMRQDAQFPSIKYLIENCPDLDVNAVDDFQNTALHIGAKYGNAAGIKYLLENCPMLEVNASNHSGITALVMVRSALAKAKRGKDQKKVEALTESIELLKAHGSRVDKELERQASENRPK